MKNKAKDFVFVGDIFWAYRPMYEEETDDEYVLDTHAITRPYFILKREKKGVIALPLTTTLRSSKTKFYKLSKSNHPESYNKKYIRHHGRFSDATNVKLTQIIELKDYDMLDLLITTTLKEQRDIFGKLITNHLLEYYKLDEQLYNYVREYYSQNFKAQVGDMINIIEINEQKKSKPNYHLVIAKDDDNLRLYKESSKPFNNSDKQIVIDTIKGTYFFDPKEKYSIPLNSDYIIKYKEEEIINYTQDNSKEEQKQFKKTIY